MWPLRTALLVSAAAAATSAAEALKEALQKLAVDKANQYNCSIAVAVRDGRGASWEVAGGISDFATNRPALADDPFVLGSITKTFTGPGVLQLVDQGVWKLDQLVAPLVDPLLKRSGRSGLEETFGKSAGRITLRNLLHMTSGLPDYDTSWNPGDPWRFLQYRMPHHDFSPLEIWDRLPRKLEFEPGTKQDYCSTGYVLLGLALAQQHGAETWDAFDQRSLIPQHLQESLKSVRFAMRGACGDFTPEHGYDRMGPPVRPVEPSPRQGRDVWNVSCLGGWTAGNAVGPVAEIATWTEAVFGGGVVSKAMQEFMRNTTVPGGERPGFYGSSAFNLSLAAGLPLPEGEAWGHLGSTYGYQSISAFFPATKATVVVASNLEIRQQDQPSDVLCSAYNYLLSHLEGKPIPTCTYKRSGYFFGECKCTSDFQREDQVNIVV